MNAFPNRFGVVLGAPLDARDVAELERPPFPYRVCPDGCGHDVEEHDEDYRCHVPGCDCGMNRG